MITPAYKTLVESGFVGSLKRDVLLKAEADVAYLYWIRREFDEAGAEARATASVCTVTFVNEMISHGVCELATWPPVGDSRYCVPVEMSREDLVSVLEQYSDTDYFLVTTESGTDWVRRYFDLLSQI